MFPLAALPFAAATQVYGLYVGLLLGALNRLPIRLPQKGPGRKHKTAESSSPVMFDDVAGVDEAKEELQEIVVRCLGGGGEQGHAWGRAHTPEQL
jgi:hypothetical protein